MTHPRNAGYIKGDYWMRCDVCGFDFRRSQMKERWDALWTCEKDWEPRHPQEFLEGVPDYQAVPVARPDNPGVYSTTVTIFDLVAGETQVVLNSVVGVEDGDSIGISLDDGTIHWTLVDGYPSGYTVDILTAMPSAATGGNTVYLKGSGYENARADEVLSVVSATYNTVAMSLFVDVLSSYTNTLSIGVTSITSGTSVALGTLSLSGTTYSNTFLGIVAAPDTILVTSSGGGTATSAVVSV